MAEALGLAVNIAALVELSTKIAKVCLQYSKEVKNAREEIARVEKETLNLKVVAESSLKLLEGGAMLKTSQALLGAAQEAVSRLKTLDVELRPPDTRKAMRRFGVRAFKWPFQSKDVEKLVRDIERYAQIISMGLQIDQTTILLSLDQKFVLDKLPIAPDASFDSHAEEHNPTCLPNTRVELLKELDQWINNPSAETVFWLNGMAGTGKSTISRTVAQSLANMDQLGASFFFKRGEGDRGHASKFFTTIASQLTTHLPMLALHVKNAIDADPAIHTKFLREQFNRLIFEPLEKLQGAYQGASIAIVVDALDECEQDNDIKVIINLFSSARALKFPRLKVLLTSRPELPVRLGFSAVRGTYNNLVLHEIPAPVIEHDISAFLEYRLAQIKDDYNNSVSDERRLPSDWPGQCNVQTLVRMAIPLFIFAATTCRFLEERRRGNPEQQLQRVLKHWNRSQEPKADLVSKFDLTYRPALDQQLTGLSPLERNEVLQEFRHIVGTIVLLSSPLSAGGVAQLLDISQHSVEDRIDMLHSVLDVPKDSVSPVRLLHLSFRDFLVDPHYRDSNPFWIDEREVHRQTATNCLRVMGNHLRENILNLKRPGTPQSMVDSLDIDACLPSQAKYACLYWTHHAEQADSGAELFGAVYDFLCRHFLHWLQVLGWLGKAYDSLPMLRAIQSAAAHSDGAALQEFVGDAIRFVQSNLHIMNTAPLQLYSSAHVFTPQRSIVHRTFAETRPSWITLQPEPELDWDQCLQKLEGHRKAVYSVAFSHDSTLIVSASRDQTVRVWRTDTGECVQKLEDHSSQVYSVAFSHDSTLIVSASWDKTVRAWRTDTGECVQQLHGHGDDVRSVAFSHDSACIVSASSDRTVRIWRTDTGECVHSLEGHSDRVVSAVFSHNSTLIISGSWDQTVRVWRTDTGGCIQQLDHSSAVWSVAFSHDSVYIVSASSDRTVRVWRTDTGGCIQQLDHNSDVWSVSISHDSALIVSSSSDCSIWLWSVSTGKCIQKFKGHNKGVWSTGFSHDSALIASASDDRTVRIWNTKAEKHIIKRKEHSGAVKRVAMSHDFGLIASSSEDTILVWRTDTGDYIQELKGAGKFIRSAAFSHDSALIASTEDSIVRVWCVSTGNCVKKLRADGHRPAFIAFSHNSALIASSSTRGDTIYIWHTHTGERKQVLKAPLEGHIESVTFSHDSTLVVSGLYENAVRIWRTDTGKCTQMLEGHESRVRSAVFSNDSAFVVSASFDQIRVWSTDTGDCVRVVHTGGWDVRVLSIEPGNISSEPGDMLSELSSTYLATDQGVIAFTDSATGAHAQLSSAQPCTLSTLGIGFSRDLCWITWNHQNLLWLPAEFRSSESNYQETRTAIVGSTVVIGSGSGRVVVFRFSEAALQLLYG
ncbi:hypothetical protein LZ32DRAFT_557994 [Colletotrichum eremochloae]|nr:hypothetical protein LZ32DRAFT_557994 [Colletotrichum eremochloae]